MDFDIAGGDSIDNTSVHSTEFTFEAHEGNIAFLEILLVKTDMGDFRIGIGCPGLSAGPRPCRDQRTGRF